MNIPRSVSMLEKITACVITAVVTAYPLARLNPNFYPASISEKFLFIFSRFLLISLLMIPLFWNFIENKFKKKSLALLELINGILAFALAFHFTKWGLLKILQLHMTTSLGLMEMPMTMVSGEKQLSHFFGQSYPMVCIIGLAEIAGAIFILFRKTRLLGAIILLFMTVNIIIIDILYDVHNPLPEAFVLFTGVLFIIFQDKEKVLNFFFQSSPSLPDFSFKSQTLKIALKSLALILPLIILLPMHKPQYINNLTGKYNITKMLINGKNIAIDQCSDSTYSKVYFDLGDFLVFTNKSFSKRQIGHFTINPLNREIEITWNYPEKRTDKFKGKLSQRDKNGRMNLTGIMGKDSLALELEKMEIKNFNKTY
jgi:hypothetical protein